MHSDLYLKGFLIILATISLLRTTAEACDVQTAKKCVQTIESNHQNWTMSEKCIEFAKSDGDFSGCKKVLEACTQDLNMLDRLSAINALLEKACLEVCPPFAEIKRQCSIDKTFIISQNYTMFCSKYAEAQDCADGYLPTCAIAKEFQAKAVVTSQLSHIYKNICNTGCSTLVTTVEALSACSDFGGTENCSIVAFDSCVRQLNETLCPESIKMYGNWFHPKCAAQIASETRPEESTVYDSTASSTSSTLIGSRTTLDAVDSRTTLEPEYTELSPTSKRKAHREGQVSSSYKLDSQHSPVTAMFIVFSSTVFSYIFLP